MTFLYLDWSHPDQLVFATVSALLRIASLHPEHRKSSTAAISDFTGQIVEMLRNGDCVYLYPAFHL